MSVVLKGGRVASSGGLREADVLLAGEKIAAVGPDLTGDETVDCRGKLLFPGFIDGHTHFDLEVCGTITADDFHTGSRAAIRGGTTMVIDYAAPDKGESLHSGLERWRRKSEGRTWCDYSYHMTVDDWTEEISREIGEMAAEGVTTYKMYMTYPAMMISEGEMYQALVRLREAGGVAGVHCENDGVIRELVRQAKAAGNMGPSSHPRTRPGLLEAEAVSHLLRLAQLADAPVIIVHLSTQAALEEVRAARRRGQRVYVETCPQYLLLEDSVYDNPDYMEAAKYVCAPPLRRREDAEALWEALKNGEIDTVATDHCSFTTAQKRAGQYDFTKIPGGLPSVEHRGVLMYTHGMAAGRLTEADLCRLLCENPAKLYGCWPRKGAVAAGADGDIVVYDPAREGVITAAGQMQNVDYTPYEGWKTAGVIERVYLRGRLAALDGNVLGVPGEFIARKGCELRV